MLHFLPACVLDLPSGPYHRVLGSSPSGSENISKCNNDHFSVISVLIPFWRYWSTSSLPLGDFWIKVQNWFPLRALERINADFSHVCQIKCCQGRASHASTSPPLKRCFNSSLSWTNEHLPGHETQQQPFSVHTGLLSCNTSYRGPGILHASVWKMSCVEYCLCFASIKWRAHERVQWGSGRNLAHTVSLKSGRSS